MAPKKALWRGGEPRVAWAVGAVLGKQGLQLECAAVGPHPQQEAHSWGLLGLQQAGHAAFHPQSHTPAPELLWELCVHASPGGACLLRSPWASLAGKAEKPGFRLVQEHKARGCAKGAFQLQPEDAIPGRKM